MPDREFLGAVNRATKTTSLNPCDSLKGKRVLVVEDEVITAMDLQYSLESLGYRVPETASSGEDAIVLAESHKPDLVLMDISLKGSLGGIEAARRMYFDLHIPVIYLTAYADAETIEKAKQTQPFGFLIKPFDDVQLKDAVEIALSGGERRGKDQTRKEELSAHGKTHRSRSRPG